MTSYTDTWPLPPVTHTASGAWRRVGVELEMGGLPIDEISAIVADFVPGELERVTSYEHLVHGDPRGDWGIELDYAFLKLRGRERLHAEEAPSPLDEAAERLLEAGARQVVPMEVVSPPLPMNEAGCVDELVQRLREAGARGTTHGLVYAFGVQLNPEIPDASPATLRNYLKAFLCLFDWLKLRARVDLTRRLTPFIDPFPVDYVRRVVDPGYTPGIARLIDDYLVANPTRNRALDMLPVFAHLDADRVRGVVPDERVKSRPTFHYRLPNCEIDRSGWHVVEAWQDWLEVERLAGDEARLNELCTRYTRLLANPLERVMRDWAQEVDAWLRS